MMRISSKALIVTSLVASIAAFTAVSFARHVDDADEVSFTFTAAGKHRVTFYTSYDTSWGGSQVKTISDGEKITSANVPSISITGYTLQGWITSAPTSSNYNINVVSSADLADVTVTTNLTYWPILKSNNKLVYVNDEFHPINADVSIDADRVGSTKIGYAYQGIDDIPVATSSWVIERELGTPSGIYQFYESDGAALIKRKVGFSTEEDDTDVWKASSVYTYGRGMWAQIGDTSTGSDLAFIHDGNTERYYQYVPYEYTRFYIKNYDRPYGYDHDLQSGAINLTDGDGYSLTNWVIHKTSNWWETWTMPDNANWGA